MYTSRKSYFSREPNNFFQKNFDHFLIARGPINRLSLVPIFLVTKLNTSGTRTFYPTLSSVTCYTFQPLYTFFLFLSLHKLLIELSRLESRLCRQFKHPGTDPAAECCARWRNRERYRRCYQRGSQSGHDSRDPWCLSPWIVTAHLSTSDVKYGRKYFLRGGIA